MTTRQITIGICIALLVALITLYSQRRIEDGETWIANDAPTEGGKMNIRLVLRRDGHFVNQIRSADAAYVTEGTYTRSADSVTLQYDSGKRHVIEVRGKQLVDKFEDGEVVLEAK